MLYEVITAMPERWRFVGHVAIFAMIFSDPDSGAASSIILHRYCSIGKDACAWLTKGTTGSTFSVARSGIRASRPDVWTMGSERGRSMNLKIDFRLPLGRTLPKLLHPACLLLMFWVFPAQAAVTGLCSSCHTMHYSQDGGALSEWGDRNNFV